MAIRNFSNKSLFLPPSFSPQKPTLPPIFNVHTTISPHLHTLSITHSPLSPASRRLSSFVAFSATDGIPPGDGGGDGRGGGGEGGDDGAGDRDNNKAEALMVVAEAGRSLESLPGDLAAAIGEGRVPGAIVKRYLEMEKSTFLRWLLQFGGFKERLLADDLFLAKVAFECGVGIFTK